MSPNGNAYVFNGSTWQTLSVSGTQLEAVSCVAGMFCMAGDNYGLGYTYTGSGNWSSGKAITTASPMRDVSCGGPGSCVAVDANGNAYVLTGSSWSTAHNFSSMNSLPLVSCASTTFCMVADRYGNTDVFNGTAWATEPAFGSGVSYVVWLSCGSSTLCVALDGSGNSYIFNGSTWTAAVPVEGGTYIPGVACRGTAFCMAVDANGNAISYNGTSWSAPTTVVAGQYLGGISCPSTSFCMTAAGNNTSWIWNGSVWSSTPIATGASGISSFDCSSSTFCALIDSNNVPYDFNGSSWTQYGSLGGIQAIWQVSCTGADTCVAGATSGYIYSSFTTLASPTITADVIPGTLAFVSAPSSFNFTPLVLNGTNQVATATETLDIGDNTGSGSGWNVTLANTPFTDASSQQLANSDFTAATPATPVCDGGATCNPASWSASTSPPFGGAGLPGPVAGKLLSSTSGTGLANQTVTLSWTASIPGNSYSGSYTSTWTLTLASGP